MKFCVTGSLTRALTWLWLRFVLCIGLRVHVHSLAHRLMRPGFPVCIVSCGVLCVAVAEEVGTYLRYCRQLDFYQEPDYAYLRQLWWDIFKREGYKVCFCFQVIDF